MRKIEIIAECGINHCGSLSTMMAMIENAKQCGADVVKFQLYDPRKRVDLDTHPYKEILLKSYLTRRQLYILKDYADRFEIEFMCSVFDADKVDWLEEINVKRHKIGSKSVFDKELLEKAFSTNKEVLISTGWITAEKTKEYNTNFHDVWNFLNKEKSRFLYCVSKYPTDYSDLEFEEFNSAFEGYSDHTIGITACIVAMSRGAKIIEKHFVLNKTDFEGPDILHSCTPNELSALCEYRNKIEKILY